MVFYLVDYENTGIKGVTGVELLTAEDRLIIFYGPKTGSVPFEDLVKITSTRAKLEFIRTTKTAKNYLDFQLTTYLGYLAAQGQAQEYVIISKDSGFDSVVDFWTERSIQISRFHNLSREILAEERKSSSRSASGSGAKKAASKKEQPKAEAKKKAASEEKKTAKKSPENKKDAKDRVAAQNGAKQNADKTGNNREKDTGKDNAGAKKSAENGQNHNAGKNQKQKQTGQKKQGNSDANQQSGGKNTAKEQQQNQVPTVPEAVKKKIRTAFKEEGLTPGAYRKLYACMLESKDKAAFNTALVHAFTQEIGNKYYKLALTAFSGFKGVGK